MLMTTPETEQTSRCPADLHERLCKAANDIDSVRQILHARGVAAREGSTVELEPDPVFVDHLVEVVERLDRILALAGQ